MRKLLIVLVAACIVLTFVSSVSGSELEKPKLISRTVYDSKWVKNEETGQLEERKIPRKQLFQKIVKRTSMPDPKDPTNSITVDVPVEIPYVPNRKANRKLDRLKDRLKKLTRREHALKAQYAQAKSSLIDLPVLEDGAPAPPDAQEIKMANDLYGEIDATQTPKAKTIKQSDLDTAAQVVIGAGAQRDAHWNFFEDVKEKMLVPSNGWSMEA